MNTLRTPFHVHCGCCGHEWPAFYLPLPLERVGLYTDQHCPMCGDAEVLTGPAPVEFQSKKDTADVS